MGGTNYVLSVLYAVGSGSIRVSFNPDNMRLMFYPHFAQELKHRKCLRYTAGPAFRVPAAVVKTSAISTALVASWGGKPKRRDLSSGETGIAV